MFKHITQIVLIVLIGTASSLLFAKATPKIPNVIKATAMVTKDSLAGWKTVNPKFQSLWSLVDGVITGGDGQTKIKHNTFLCTEKEYGNFEFRSLFKLSGVKGTGLINSGIQYRTVLKECKLAGYQADIGNKYWGDIYDEHRRGLLVKGDLTILKDILKRDGWNSYIIRCIGNHHELYINGVKTVDYYEKDEVPHKGVIGIQLHSGGKAKIEFKHVTITEL